jgi:hypothetical protein
VSVASRASDVPRTATAEVAKLTKTHWRGAIAAVAIPTAIALLIVRRAQSVTDLFLTPDGAHYIADADALLGHGARELRHPPLFPALLATVRPFTGELDSFMWTMAVAMVLLVVAVYVLLRAWFPVGIALIGAAAAGVTPVGAELFAWGGGATMLGIAMMVFTLAAMERWIERGGRWALVVGACLGATALTHAFPVALAVVALGVRWTVVLVSRRRLGVGWDALGVRGIIGVAILAVPAYLVASRLYFGPRVGFRAPQFRVSWDLLQWALKDGHGGWALAGAAVVGLALSEHRGVLAYGLTLLAIDVAFPAMLQGDVIYANRAEYVLPIVIGLGAASLAHLVLVRWMPPTATRSALMAAAAIGLCGVLFVTFLPRFQRSVGYYNVWLTRDDAVLIQSLQGRDGTVATSWRAHDYGTGVNLSWIVEGVGKRPALGAADAALASIPSQIEGGSDMQRVFAGFHGIENDAVQVTAGPVVADGDLGIQIRSTGLAYPFAVMRSLRDRYPVNVSTVDSSLEQDGLVWSFGDRGEDVMTRSATVSGRTVTLRYNTSRATRGRWLLELAPAPGMSWSRMHPAGSGVGGEIGIRSDVVPFSVNPVDPAVDVSYAEGVIRVAGFGASTLVLEIAVQTRGDTGELRTFRERDLLRERNITEAVVLKDTGLLERFDADPCFERGDHSERFSLYRVTAACLGSTG